MGMWRSVRWKLRKGLERVCVEDSAPWSLNVVTRHTIKRRTIDTKDIIHRTRLTMLRNYLLVEMNRVQSSVFSPPGFSCVGLALSLFRLVSINLVRRRSLSPPAASSPTAISDHRRLVARRRNTRIWNRPPSTVSTLISYAGSSTCSVILILPYVQRSR